MDVRFGTRIKLQVDQGLRMNPGQVMHHFKDRLTEAGIPCEAVHLSTFVPEPYESGPSRDEFVLLTDTRPDQLATKAREGRILKAAFSQLPDETEAPTMGGRLIGSGPHYKTPFGLVPLDLRDTSVGGIATNAELPPDELNLHIRKSKV